MMKEKGFRLGLTLLFLLTLLIPVQAAAPVAENLELSTYRGVAIGGRLSATDPDGDEVTFEITTSPGKGSIDLDTDGRFVYTPADGKRGKDYFGYKAVDSEGNRSQEATVIIRIQKQKSKITYTDTAAVGSAYAAVRLAEEGIFTGERLAGSYVFSPNRPVTRQEFLTMCMRLAGSEGLGGGRTTGFADDADIDAWAKPYVVEAVRNGIISGYATEDSAPVFRPNQPITVAEAAVMLDRTVGLTDAVAAWYGYEGALPAWALQSASNISACGLLPYGCSFSDSTLSRGDSAQMLAAAIEILAKR